jgi:peptidoglycan/xylan/chitin deacetylase (PgdA/CDA1 family)
MNMLRSLAKGGVAAGFHALGVDRVVGIGRRLQHVPLVLSYHRVVENYEASRMHSISPMLVSAATFEKQIDWIGKHYEFVALDDLAQALEAGDLRKPIAAVTFDDGYGDAYYHAFPILKRKGIPMAVFVVTDLVGSPELQLHDELHLLIATAFAQWQKPAVQLATLAEQAGIEPSIKARLCAPDLAPFARTRLCLELLQQSQIAHLVLLLRSTVKVTADTLAEFHALTWEMLNHMAANGVTIGSHTKSHKLLVNESWPTVLEELRGSRLEELRGSRAELEQRLGKKVEHFAYPDGRFNSDALRAVAVAGFRYAYTTCMHRDREHPLLTIPRRVLWENSCVDGFGRFSPSILSCQINGIFDPAARCQQVHFTPAPSGKVAGAESA